MGYIPKYYTLKTLISSNKNGQVWIATKKDKNTLYIIKLINESLYRNEYRVLKRVTKINDPHLIHLRDIILPKYTYSHISNIDFNPETKFVGLVFPCYKMNLLNYVSNIKNISNHQCYYLFQELALGVSLLHSNRIAHLDLKLENVVLDDNNMPIIIDFGFAAADVVSHTSFCGSYSYVAPEVIKNIPYNPYKADIWSLGVLFYAIICQTFPFNIDSFESVMPSSPETKISFLFDRICKQQIVYPDYLPLSAKNLLSAMLDRNPSTRYDINQVLADPLFRYKWHPVKNLPKYNLNKLRLSSNTI